MDVGRGQRGAGFSLVELTLSLAIIAIVSAIAMPRYARAVANYRAKAAAQRIAADLAQTQSYARTSSTSQSITFNTSTNKYQIANARDLDSSANTYTVSLADEPYRSAFGTVSLGSPAKVVFDGYGMPDRGGSLTVQSGAATSTVTIDATTGKVVVR